MAEDGLELDSIIALEGRITAALDRIAGAAAANAVAAKGADDAGDLAAATAQSDALATELSEVSGRVETLEAELAAAQARADGLETELAAAQAAQDGMRAETDAAAGELRAELEAAQAALAAAEAQDGDADTLAELQEKADRLRSERDETRAARDGLAEELDAYRSAALGEPAALVQALRSLRGANAALRDSCEDLRKSAMTGDVAPSADSLDAAMAAEILSLRAERAADAAEMQLILDELRPLTEGAANA